MATYYVRPDGSDTNTGLGSTTGLAWATFGKAFASGSPVVGGDIIYIAPGTYTESITVNATSPTSEVRVVGNPTASQFIGVSPGFVRLSSFNSAGTSAVFSNTFLISATSKNYYSFENIHFDCNHAQNNIGGVMFMTSRYLKFIKCLFTNSSTAGLGNIGMLHLTATASTALDATVDRCVFGATASQCLSMAGASLLTDTSTVKDSLFVNGRMLLTSLTVSVINSTVVGADIGIQQITGSANAYVSIQNSLFVANQTAILGTSTSTIQQTYCRFAGNNTNLQNCNTSATSQTTGNGGIDYGYAYQNGLNPLVIFGSYSGSPNTSFGNSSGAPSVDLFDALWSGTSPDAGAVTFKSMTGVSAYLPGNQTASTITIAPGSTSQSIELYLGATGLTASTSGLSARYNRTRTASVSIPLVARTIGQAWTAGGFAEVDATNMPGIYRLDLPDAALAAGADDVTIVVRGASGTNGAVMTVKLSSGGLTSAQTASAVWDAATASYTANGTFGLNVLRADQQNKVGNVTLSSANNVNRVDADVHAIANDIAAATALKGALNHDGTGYIDSDIVRISTSTAAADELEGALLHNGTDYISAELLTPVSAATSVHIGPYQLLADGLGADQPLDVNVGTATSIDVQVTDANGTGIDITGATVSAKVYNAGGTLVATYAGTATYADNGRLTFGLTTTVTNTSGTYTVTVTRTTGASDTQVFGPLKLYVRPV